MRAAAVCRRAVVPRRAVAARRAVVPQHAVAARRAAVLKRVVAARRRRRSRAAAAAAVAARRRSRKSAPTETDRNSVVRAGAGCQVVPGGARLAANPAPNSFGRFALVWDLFGLFRLSLVYIFFNLEEKYIEKAYGARLPALSTKSLGQNFPKQFWISGIVKFIFPRAMWTPKPAPWHRTQK